MSKIKKQLINSYDLFSFLCPAIKWREGIKGFPCPCVCVCDPDSCPTRKYIVHGGIKNHLAQMIIKTAQCVARKNHIAR